MLFPYNTLFTRDTLKFKLNPNQTFKFKQNYETLKGLTILPVPSPKQQVFMFCVSI